VSLPSNGSDGDSMSTDTDTDVGYHEALQQIEQPTEDEYEQLRGEFDTIYVPRKQKKTSLHLFECHHVQSVGTTMDEKSFGIYPYDYLKVCEACLYEYHNDD